MKKSLVLLAGALLLVLFCVPVSAVTVTDSNIENYDVLSHYSQVVYDFDNGLPTSGVNDILQTRDGYLWAASYDGLIRYDGSRFTVFSPETDGAFESSGINVLFEDTRGLLWVGTNEKGALVYENGVFTKIDSGPLSVTAFAEGPDGTIYLGAREGIYIVSGGTASAMDGATAASVANMLADKNGRLWVVDSDGALVAPEGVSAKFDRKARYSGLYKDGAGAIYLGGEAGEVVRLTPNGDDYTAEKIETGLSRIHSFFKTNSGDVWMCSDSGLGYLEGSRFHLAGGALFYSSLETIIEDHEGSLWVASSRNGLLQLIPGVMRDVFFAADIPANIVNSAIEYGGHTYIATDDRLIVLDNEYEPVETDLTKLLWNVRTRCLAVDSKENLWLATYETHGAVCYAKDGEITEFNEERGLNSNKTRVVMEAGNGDIIVGTSAGLNVIRGGEVVETYGKGEGLLNETILSLVEGKGGRIYAGTDGGGIFCLENGRVTRVDMGALDSNVILRMLYDEPSDTFWIATSSCFYRYTGGNLARLDYVPQEVGQVFDIVADPAGKLWLLASRGIVSGMPEDLAANHNVVIMKKKDGLPYQTTANSWSHVDTGGNLLVSGTNGLGMLSTAGALPPAPEPRVIIEQVLVDGTPYPAGQEISLPSGARRLTLKVVAPHFSPKSDITVEYLLENFDDDWQRQTAENLGEITYTNLRGGSYTFHVRAANSGGMATPEQQVALYKEPTAVERPVFWVSMVALALMLAAAATVLAVHARTAKLLRRQQEYKRITDQTVATISNAIDAKDQYTEGHSERVAAYSVEIGRRLGMGEYELEKLRYVALLHDIGKIGITDSILNKPGRLTDDEFSVMRSHTTIGGKILKDFTAIDNIGEGAAGHHEKYDGTGYPNKLKGEQISLPARIIGVCDTYDAMATRRSYKEPMTKDYMVGELTRCSGTQFDPRIAAVMIEMVKDGFAPLSAKPAENASETDGSDVCGNAG